MRNQSGTGYDLAGPGASETRFDTIKSVTSHSLEQPSMRILKDAPLSSYKSTGARLQVIRSECGY